MNQDTREDITRTWNKWIPLVLGTFVAMIILAIGSLMCYWLYWPTNPEVVHSIHISNNQVPGQSLYYTINLCKNTDVTPSLTRGIAGVDGTNFNIPYPVVSGAIKPGCETTKISLTLPANTPPGKYQLRDVADFQVNPIRHVYVITDSNVFTVK